MDTEFTYYAFISYSHKDEKIARKLHHYLEHYKLPNVLYRKFPHIPKKLRPVFIDTEELEINELTEAISEALNASRFLIVICSENSVKPNEQGINWIDREVRAFLDLRPENAKRVIPVILRDEGGLSAYDCLLPVIQERGILGADVLKKGEERVFSDVVAKMAGLKPDTLWDRHQRELRKQRRNRRILGGIAAALTAAASWYCWDYYVPHVSYYTDYIERDNIPEGLFELTEEQMKVRERHYRFTMHRHLLQTVEYCNSAGTVQEHIKHWHMERPAGMEFSYDDEGNAYKCVHRNAQGKEITVRKFSAGCIDFVQSKGEIEVKQSVSFAAGIAANHDTSPGQKADIGRFVVSRCHETPLRGLVSQELYRKFGSDTQARDTQGLSGRSYELDALGRPAVVRYLRESASGAAEPMETQKGIAGYRLTYGEGGHIIAATFLDKEEKPILNDEHWAQLQMSYDVHGNIVEKAFYAPDGKPCLHKDGYSRVAYRYDARGNRVEETSYGTGGAPCTNANGYARRIWVCDERGNQTEETYFGADGAPCLHKNGYARITCRYDERGNKVEEAFFNADSRPCQHRDGHARITCRYDERGNRVEVSYFGTDGTPHLHKDGHARTTWRYDARGNRVEEAYFGIDGAPCLDKDMVARVTARYDERGNSVEQAYFGTDGNPCLHKDGVARLTVRYDERGNRVEQAYFGTDGMPCCHLDGNARVTWKYDERGNWVEKSYFDATGSPCLLKSGYARITCRYDARGNRVEEAYYNIDNQPCNNKDGYARILRTYDERGKVAMSIRYDAMGKEISRENK